MAATSKLLPARNKLLLGRPTFICWKVSDGNVDGSRDFLQRTEGNRSFFIGSMGRLYIYLHEWLILMVNVGSYGIRKPFVGNMKTLTHLR